MENAPQIHPSGTYRYIPAITAYSSGVAVERDHSILGLQFGSATPLERALRRIDYEIARLELAPTALAGLQLRSTAVMSPGAFDSFNERYLELLDARGLLIDGSSPLSRTNVVPLFGAPTETVVHAAFLVVPDPEQEAADFVVAGSGEAAGGLGAAHITAFADVSAEGIRAKAQTVVDIMLERLEALGHDPTEPTGVNVYTAHDAPSLATLLSARIPACEWSGFHVYPSRPPVSHVEYEMDCSRVRKWQWLEEERAG